MMKFCPNCGAQLIDRAKFCTACGRPCDGGAAQGAQQPPKPSDTFSYVSSPTQDVPAGYSQKSRVAAGLLGIFVGGLGIHNFYLGYTTRGIVQLVLSVVTAGLVGVWGFVEGILLLCGSVNADANGVALRD